MRPSTYNIESSEKGIRSIFPTHDGNTKAGSAGASLARTGKTRHALDAVLLLGRLVSS
jgi:hypothetical protein